MICPKCGYNFTLKELERMVYYKKLDRKVVEDLGRKRGYR